jgi:hypothetical protein
VGGPGPRRDRRSGLTIGAVLAVGLASLAQFLGIVLAMALGPIVVNGDPASAGYGSGTDHLLLVLFAAGLGIFNALSSLVGALVLPILSDAASRRKPFLTLCMAGMIPGVAGLA